MTPKRYVPAFPADEGNPHAEECPECGRLIQAYNIPLEETPVCFDCYARVARQTPDKLALFAILASISLFVMLCATLVHVFFRK